MSPLLQRVLTAVVLISLFLSAILFLPKGFGIALLALLALGGAWEWSAFLRLGTRPLWRWGYVALVGVFMALSGGLVSDREMVVLVAGCALLWWLAAFVLVLRFPVPIRRGVAASCGVLVLLPAWVCLLALLLTSTHGRSLLLLAFAIVWAADIGAYFVGRRYGRVKLAPRVSPGKTWEGVMGGLACATAVAAAAALLLGHRPGPAALLGLTVAAISIVGDLTVSVFKRSAGVKDSGNLFPGHGGILDRIDSVTAAAPLFVLEAGWIGWLAP